MDESQYLNIDFLLQLWTQKGPGMIYWVSVVIQRNYCLRGVRLSCVKGTTPSHPYTYHYTAFVAQQGELAPTWGGLLLWVHTWGR